MSALRAESLEKAEQQDFHSRAIQKAGRAGRGSVKRKEKQWISGSAGLSAGSLNWLARP